jgi:hypothetical protein
MTTPRPAWMRAMLVQRLELYIQATDPDPFARGAAVSEMGALLEQAMEELAVITETVCAEAQASCDTATDLLVHTRQLVREARILRQERRDRKGVHD